MLYFIPVLMFQYFNIIIEFGIIILEVACYGCPQLPSELLDKLGFLLVNYYCYIDLLT